MTLKIIVTVKQVPNTHNITSDAMKSDGTVNRSALSAIFNPEDLNALEEALKIKESLLSSNVSGNSNSNRVHNGAHIIAITMGPPKAIEVLQDCLYRGVDEVILLSDQKFAGADTLATSYALAMAIKKIAPFDLIICGRQAIDGDTAQVGPQLAEKLNINQITNVCEINQVLSKEDKITVKRTTDYGIEILRSNYPLLITVTSEANSPRPASAKKVMSYKNLHITHNNTHNTHTCLREWSTKDIDANLNYCGVNGSPTKVKSIQNVILTSSNSKQIANTDNAINELIKELTSEHILS
ncbi:MAG: electron transfer flavoprotein subunit beta/FixA family protein [Oligoflexia bacterium]|nr:electron transfer flavoprotein subunit beta/FixA family protein [Oligoflexia bacterium]